MNEAEWLNGWRYQRMYRVVYPRSTVRQTRLYMVACCRLETAELFDPRILRALEMAERCADDPRLEDAVNAVWFELSTSPHPQLPQSGPEREAAQAVTGIWHLLDEWWDNLQYPTPRHAIVHAAYLCLRLRPRETFTGGAGNAAEYCARAIEQARLLKLGVKQEVEESLLEVQPVTGMSLADILREIFGNPFRPVTLEPHWLAWCDGLLRQLAETSYQERRLPSGHLNPGSLAILADALEEAGCTSEDILGHLRGPGPHIRGCWVVDLVRSAGSQMALFVQE